MQISGQDLYERVWKTPLRKIATEFGISDVALPRLAGDTAYPRHPLAT